ncbi:MAG: URC4/urg3 family protein [Kaiparowitsia implicata GSE-PSE-MK54-09C]|jgi:hypothetical protein|nr:URC4/urg3 family protein [Kaiparowitsia implicata GSE-PSE-MK54-09C]
MDASVASLESAAIAHLRTPQAIRERCGVLFEQACAGRLQHFRCNLDRLDATADYVLTVMHANYPTLDVPFHSRWRHFGAGGVDRRAQLAQQLAALDPVERARVHYDLVIPSVLLDAGAGAAWHYHEAESGITLGRSEGLAIASYHLFLSGALSDDDANPLQTTAAGLETLTEATLCQRFQVSDANPLVGVAGRLALMQRLGRSLRQHSHYFTTDGSKPPRPGYLVDYLLDQAVGNQLSAPVVLGAVLEGLGDIWAGRITLGDTNLGDVWPHSALPHDAPGSNLVPFHKLSQWLTYSLLEPLQALGLTITDLDQLTGLAEYRNGGLCVDLGLLTPRYPDILTDRHLPSAEVIVEWRALTVALLDRVGDRIRTQLHLSPVELPLVKILEGGTWAAGRKIAADLRPDGSPPIQINSDGTVF